MSEVLDTESRDWEIYTLRLQMFTLEEIGERYNLTRERVRQICDRVDAIKKLPIQTTDIKILRVIQELGIKKASDFEGVSYSTILSIAATGQGSVRKLESLLAQQGISLVPDVDLSKYKRNPYKKTGVRVGRKKKKVRPEAQSSNLKPKKLKVRRAKIRINH